MQLVLTLHEPYFTCEADRFIVLLHFLMVQNGYRVIDDIRQGSFFIFQERC